MAMSEIPQMAPIIAAGYRPSSPSPRPGYSFPSYSSPMPFPGCSFRLLDQSDRYRPWEIAGDSCLPPI